VVVKHDQSADLQRGVKTCGQFAQPSSTHAAHAAQPSGLSDCLDQRTYQRDHDEDERRICINAFERVRYL
jgi:hypothetical protein